MDRQKEKQRVGQNLVHLVKLQFLQKRFLFLGLLLLEFFYVVYGIVSNLRERSLLGDGIHIGDVGGLPQVGCFIVLLLLCLGSYNAADNKHLNMYPGIRKTRYFSRIILDYLFLFCFSAWMAALYLAVYGVYQVVRLVLPDINLSYFFSWEYMFQGCTGVFVFSILLYGIIQFIYSIMYFLGKVGYLIAGLIGLLLCAFFVSQLCSVYYLLQQPFSWKETVGLCFLAGTLITIVNSFVVIWKKKPLRAVPGSVVLLAVTGLLFSISLKLLAEYQDIGQYGSSREETEEGQSSKRVFHDFELSWENVDRIEFLKAFGFVFLDKEQENKYKNSLSFTKDIYSVSDRKLRKAEGFDRSKVTKEKFLLRMEADNAAYKGMPVYQDILENIELKKKGKELYYSCNNRYYALNYMFGKPYSSKEDVAHKIWEMSKNGITDKMFLTAIIDDETWELYKKAEYAEE